MPRLNLMAKGLSGVGFEATKPDIHVGFTSDPEKRVCYHAIVVAAPTRSTRPLSRPGGPRRCRWPQPSAVWRAPIYRDGWEWSPYMPKPERSDTAPSTSRYRVPLTTPVATWDAPMWVVRVVHTAAEGDMASAGYHGRLRAPPRKWLLRRGGLLAHNARGWAGPGRVVHEAPVERLWRYAIQEVDVWMSTGRTRSDGAPHRVAKLYHSRLPTEARIGL